MNILIIEDEPLTVLGLKQKIGEINPIAVVSTAASVDTAFELAARTMYELVILDIDIKGKVGARVVERMKSRYPETAILVITDLEERIYGFPYMKAGADGFLSKLASSGQFDEAIRAMMVMGKYASAALQQQIIQENQVSRSARYSNPLMSISDRERQVLEHLIAGKSTGEIAAILNINKTTVGSHKMRILKKMQVNSLIKLIEKVTMLS
ncbi:response regulator transcription factor [Dyadobacter sp. CY261]|uniref:response regulator transcription factor n=1 Tax=Dyadobacter sp. CY261 TaxID=2907203 RepID=UPI001F2ADB8F|nr:response regulator transcription factor [Dyadobacter sp. CY261]MCF0070168.1 response regulator transcription factor [Dyadobacter sp. CY261]